MLIEKVYFPPPPPTFNTLTSAERAHLRCSRNKLGRVLGITPQVVDFESDTTIGEPERLSRRVRGFKFIPDDAGATIQSRDRWLTRASNTMRLFSSTSSCVDFPEEEPRCCSNYSRLMESGVPGSRSNSIPHPPLLRVARSTHSRSVSNSNALNLPSYNSHGSPESDGSDEDSLPDLHSGTSSDSDMSEPPSPTICPHSLNAMRLKKIQRLQRILGEEVPVDMIFHDKRDDESSFESSGECQGACSTGLSVTVMKRRRSAPAGSFHFPFLSSKEQAPKRPTTTIGSPSLTTEKLPHDFSSRPATPVSPASPKTRRKRPATLHPHYRVQSSLQDTSLAQPAAPVKYSYVYYPNQSDPPLPLNDGSATEYGDATSLQTIIESPDEIENALSSRASGVFHEMVSSRRWSSDTSLKSKFYPGDLHDRHAPKATRSFDETRSLEAKSEMKRTWSHRRKPVPVYEL